MVEYQASVTFTKANGDKSFFHHGGIAPTAEEGLTNYINAHHPDALIDAVRWAWTRPFPQEFTVCVNCTMEAGLEESFRTREAAMRWVTKVMASPRVHHIVLYDNYSRTAMTIC